MLMLLLYVLIFLKEKANRYFDFICHKGFSAPTWEAVAVQPNSRQMQRVDAVFQPVARMETSGVDLQKRLLTSLAKVTPLP